MAQVMNGVARPIPTRAPPGHILRRGSSADEVPVSRVRVVSSPAQMIPEKLAATQKAPEPSFQTQNSAFGIPSPRPAPPTKPAGANKAKRKRLGKRASDEQGPRQGSMSSNVSASFSSIKSFDSTCSVPHPTVADSRDAAFNFIRSDPRFHSIPFEHYIDPTEIFIAQGGEGAQSSVIGEGGQGTIFRATVSSLGSNPVAVKVSQSQSIMEEYATALKFDHKHILKPLGFSVATAEQIKMASEIDDSDLSSCSTPRSIGAPDQWIFMAMYELCEHGDLASFLVKNPTKATDMVFLRRLFINIVEAVGHMHKRGYVHCDVKPENILVDSKFEPRLADFGMSQPFSDRMIAQGTPSFLAPEVVEAWFDPRAPHRFEDKIDIFSVGVMALYIVSGKYPFRRITRRLRKGISFSPKELKEIFVPADRCTECIERLSPEFADIVRQCMSHDPDARPSARGLLKLIKDV